METKARKRGRKPKSEQVEQLVLKDVAKKKDVRAANEARQELARRELSRRKLLAFTQYRFPTYKVNWHHKMLADALERVERGELKRLIVNMPPRHGKLCGDNTDVFTSSGWKKHGELKYGDMVFHPSGQMIRVLGVSKKDNASLEVEFSNGEKIKVHPNHEWTVYDRAFAKWRTLETKDILNTKYYSGNRSRFQLSNINALEGYDLHLPLDPYFFGAWLGDGTSSAPAITSEFKDKDIIENCNYHVNKVFVQKDTGVPTYYFSHQGIIQKIRELGCYKNKHIPNIYKNSSIKQRLQLLAGLIDTDGSKDKNSRYRIVTVSKKLAEDIAELVTGLGMRPYIMEAKPVLSTSGIQGKQITYSVGFQPTIEIPVALERKKVHRIVKQNMIGIVSIKECEPELGHCIQVDSEDGLYLVGKTLIPTHNSELVSVNFPAWCMGRDKDRSIIAASYGADLATDFGRKVRNIMDENAYRVLFDTRLAEDAKAKGSWATNGRGEYNAVGVGGAITGKGGAIIIVDDYFKNREDADSEVMSEKLWDWWKSTLRTRITPDGAFVIVACMTGDTMVTMADGSKKELKYIRKGDYISTYHNGKVKKSVVKNWTSQGNDKVLTITTSCGIIVKANERHPFLIFNNKELKWIRTKQLSIGQKIVTLKGSGVNGKVKNVKKKDVKNQLFVEDYVPLTIIKKNGLLDIVLHQIMQYPIVIHVLKNVTGLLQKIMKKCLSSKTVDVQSVKNYQGIMCEPIGVENSVLTTTTKQEKLGHYYVMTVIWQWVMQKMNLMRWGLLNTSDFTLDEIVSIEESGIEEVFDIEVDETENFIANGIVSHNTRWRDNDLVGRILEEEKLRGENTWEVIKLPAIAEEDEENREQGEALWADHYTLDMLQATKDDIGNYEFAAQYQQNPVNRETQIFKEELFRYINWEDIKKKQTNCYITIDSALSKKKTSDNTGVCINFVDGENIWYLKSYKVRVDPEQLIQLIFDLHQVYKPVAIGLEETVMTQAIDPFLTVEMGKKNIFPNVVPLKHGGTSKEIRIRGLLPRYERGYIYHISGMCGDLENELVRFPSSAHDDVMDATAYQIQIAEAANTSFNYADFEAKELQNMSNEIEILYKDIGI